MLFHFATLLLSLVGIFSNMQCSKKQTKKYCNLFFFLIRRRLQIYLTCFLVRCQNPMKGHVEFSWKTLLDPPL